MKIFPLILLAVVAGIFGWFVMVFSLSTLLKQHDAESFPHVQGEVLSSQVTITHGSKGSIHYHPSINYRYTVDGWEHTGWRYRYDGHPTDSSSANTIVSEHPAGSAIDVYYRPGYPEDCLLCPGVDQPDVGMFFFFAAIIMFFLWLIIAKGGKEIIWPWQSALVAGGMEVITEMMVVRVRLPRFLPLTMGLITAAILCVVAAGFSLFAFPAMSPWTVWQCSIAGILLGGAAVYAWQYLNIRSGKQDLVIDEGARTILLPLTYRRREQTPIPFSQVRSVVIDKVRHQTKNGVYYTYMVALDMADNSEQKLIDLNQTRATSLASWLKGKFGLTGEPLVLDA